jgi:hypothetical protein
LLLLAVTAQLTTITARISRNAPRASLPNIVASPSDFFAG